MSAARRLPRVLCRALFRLRHRPLPAAPAPDGLAATSGTLLPVAAEVVQAADGHGAVRAVLPVVAPVAGLPTAVARLLTVAQAGIGPPLHDDTRPQTGGVGLHFLPAILTDGHRTHSRLILARHNGSAHLHSPLALPGGKPFSYDDKTAQFGVRCSDYYCFRSACLMSSTSRSGRFSPFNSASNCSGHCASAWPHHFLDLRSKYASPVPLPTWRRTGSLLCPRPYSLRRKDIPVLRPNDKSQPRPQLAEVRIALRSRARIRRGGVGCSRC